MKPFLAMLAVFAGYIVMYRLYGSFLSKRIFRLEPTATVPSKIREDGMDFVPTRREILFGHHFASIAGTGLIVGPAIAVIWGWLPAILWVFAGSVFMGGAARFRHTGHFTA